MIIKAASKHMALQRHLLMKIITPNYNKETKLIRKFSLAACRNNQQDISLSQSKKSDKEKMAYFGFKLVTESERDKEIYKVFETVASTYDRVNDVMSFGYHRKWKDILIQELTPTHGSRLIDVAGGTGDITFRYLNYLNNLKNPEKIKSHVTITDINQHMLDVGKARAQKMGFTAENGYDITWMLDDAENLSCPDESFTVYTTSLGLRCITCREKALAEAYRVLKPGGRFLCLELSHVTNDFVRWLYDKYSFGIIPIMGTYVSGKREPFNYLIESIRTFPKQEELKGMIEDAGFRQVTYKNLSFGIVAIHSGFKV